MFAYNCSKLSRRSADRALRNGEVARNGSMRSVTKRKSRAWLGHSSLKARKPQLENAGVGFDLSRRRCWSEHDLWLLVDMDSHDSLDNDLPERRMEIRQNISLMLSPKIGSGPTMSWIQPPKYQNFPPSVILE